jgi:hypothetical protein
MQVAQITGGRVLNVDDPSLAVTAPALWMEEGVKMPVARTPIWLAVTLAALALFLLDVAVRRVRADIAAMKKWIGGLVARRQATQAQLGGLKAAREQARERLKLRSEQTGTRLSESELAAEAKREVAQAQATASKKFEASVEDLQQASKGPVALGGSSAQPSRPAPKPAPGQNVPNEADGMNRLMAAKRKAREDLNDEGKGNQ